MSVTTQPIDEPLKTTVLGETGGGAYSRIVRLSGLACRDELWKHREHCLESLRSNPFASVDLHPDLLLSLCQNPDAGVLMFADWSGAGDGHRRGARLAVLAKRLIRLRMLPKPDWRVVFNGHRLLGNEVIGCDSCCDAAPFVEEIARLLLQHETDCVLLENLTLGSALHHAITDAASDDDRFAVHEITAPQPRWWIDFPANPSDYWKKFSKNSRKRFRSDARKFDHELLRFTSSDDVGRFLKLASAVSRASWQGRRLGHELADSGEARRSMQRLAEIGVFRSYILQHHDRPVAYRIGRQWNGKYTSERIGHDVEFSRFGVGTLLMHRVIEDLIAHDSPRVFDFDFGDGQHKRFFGNRQTLSAAVMLVPRTAKNSAILGVHRVLSRTLIRIRSSRLYKRLRRSYRE